MIIITLVIRILIILLSIKIIRDSNNGNNKNFMICNDYSNINVPNDIGNRY